MVQIFPIKIASVSGRLKYLLPETLFLENGILHWYKLCTLWVARLGFAIICAQNLLLTSAQQNLQLIFFLIFNCSSERVVAATASALVVVVVVVEIVVFAP